MYVMITNSDINGLETLHVTFMDLTHNQLTGYSINENKVN